ncbi:hypothetical protein [uncultured Clostridium sp.]|uniref:hypothetical protein n=1 Tax=uncultured Clostridium sp. TaxID=59620 RepID=UPI00261815AA|nr:hypothetical protein [uncultured Clostridium sp.]
MKTNFICPKCKKHIVVGKKLHATYICPNCHYHMVLSKEDVQKGTMPYKSWFKVEGDTWRPKSHFNNNFKKPYNKTFIQK